MSNYTRVNSTPSVRDMHEEARVRQELHDAAVASSAVGHALGRAEYLPCPCWGVGEILGPPDACLRDAVRYWLECDPLIDTKVDVYSCSRHVLTRSDIDEEESGILGSIADIYTTWEEGDVLWVPDHRVWIETTAEELVKWGLLEWGWVWTATA